MISAKVFLITLALQCIFLCQRDLIDLNLQNYIRNTRRLHWLAKLPRTASAKSRGAILTKQTKYKKYCSVFLLLEFYENLDSENTGLKRHSWELQGQNLEFLNRSSDFNLSVFFVLKNKFKQAPKMIII